MDESVRAVVRETQTALQSLTDQHELLKKVHAKLAHDYKNALDAAADAEARRVQTETECQTLYKNWNSQLKAQADEFEKIQSQMLPTHQVELIKVEVKEKMKKPHLEEVNALKRELEESRRKFVKEHREKELLLTKMEELASQSEQHETTYHQMSKQIQNLKREKTEQIANIEEAHSCTQDELRTLARENAELQLLKKKLLRENAEVRSDMEKAVADRDRNTLEHIKQCKQFEANIDILNARICQNGKRLEASLNRAAEGEKNCGRLEKERDAARQQLGESISQCNTLQEQHNAKLNLDAKRFNERAESWLRARRVLEREMESLQGRIEAGERRELEAQDAARAARQTLAEEHETQLGKMHEQLDALVQHKNELEQSLGESISGRERVEQEAAEESGSLRQACEALRGSLRSKQHENVALKASLKTLNDELHDAQQQNTTLSSSVRVAEAAGASALREAEEAGRQQQEAARRVERLQERVALLQEELRETHEHALGEQQQLSDVRRSLEADQQRLKDAVQLWHTHTANRSRHKDALVLRMQKQRDRYKKMVKTLKRRVSMMMLERVRTMNNVKGGDTIECRFETNLEKEDGAERDAEAADDDEDSMKTLRQQEDESQKEFTQLFKRLQTDSPLNI